MNERIRKLYYQANSRYTNDYALSGKPREEWRSIPDLFAELIVRECADIDFRREVGLTADDDYEIGKVIKAHFGVEQ